MHQTPEKEKLHGNGISVSKDFVVLLVVFRKTGVPRQEHVCPVTLTDTEPV